MDVEQLEQRLRLRAGAAQKAGAEAYFKGAVPFRGVKSPEVLAVFRELQTELDQLDGEARLSLSFALLDQEWAELRHLGVLSLHRGRKMLPTDWLVRAEPILVRRATNWGTADAFAMKVLRYRMPIADDKARVLTWANAESPWLRRMACVAFEAEARKGQYAEEIRVVVAGALGLQHRFSQLGAGWLLRERWRAAPEEVEAFLLENGARMSREAVRYAVERIPTERRQSLLAATR